MTTIAKTFDFDAAHFLPNVPDGHKCKRMHGHTYRVTVYVTGKPDPETGMICDYQDIADAWGPVHAVLDHHTLNDIEGLENPTTELLAPWVFKRLAAQLPGLSRVRVYESSTTFCEVTTWEA